MPSSRSPSEISFSSAMAFNTLSKFFSRRTPVWTRSTAIALCTMVTMYHGSQLQLGDGRQLAAGNDSIDHAVFQCLSGLHDVVAIHIARDLFDSLSGGVGED